MESWNRGGEKITSVWTKRKRGNHSHSTVKSWDNGASALTLLLADDINLYGFQFYYQENAMRGSEVLNTPISVDFAIIIVWVWTVLKHWN